MTQKAQARQAIESLALANKPVCVHCSFRSLDGFEGGPNGLIDEFLDAGCTLMALALSYAFMSPPPADRRPSGNGLDYRSLEDPGAGRVYSPSSNELNQEMVGVFVKTLLERPGRCRGNHPRSSFVAVGPLARELTQPQASLDVFAPLRVLCEKGGQVLLMGVGSEKMTLIHLAEQNAGREPFRRWATGPGGHPIEVQEGGCSSGFGNLRQALAPLSKVAQVGASTWECFDASTALFAATASIRANPQLTHCNNADCLECADAIRGGPTE